MRVALYKNSILEIGGGLEKFFIETAKNMSDLYDIQVDIVTMDDEFTNKLLRIWSKYYFNNKISQLNFKESSSSITAELGRAKYYKCKSFHELRERLNEYDVIYSKNEIAEAVLIKFFLRYDKLPPIIFGCHTPLFYQRTHSFHSRLHNILYNGWFYQFVTNGVKAFHVINDFDEKLINKLFPNKKITKIYNSFNVRQFKKMTGEFVFDLQSDNKFKIIWIGRLNDQKGIFDLINIIKLVNLKNYHDMIAWNILGDGPERNKIEQMAKLYKNVHYYGQIDHKYIASILSQCNLLISTSKSETFSYVIIEAITMDVPVLSYNIPGPQDIIKNSNYGILVNNINEFIYELKKIINNDRRFDHPKKSIIEQFNPDQIYPKLLNLFSYYAKK